MLRNASEFLPKLQFNRTLNQGKRAFSVTLFTLTLQIITFFVINETSAPEINYLLNRQVKINNCLDK